MNGLLAQCDSPNESFNPAERYGDEMRSFDLGDADRLPYFEGDDFRPFWPEVMKGERELAATAPDEAIRIPDFAFTDQDDREFGSEQLRGKIYLANFFFTRCRGICPLTMPRLRGVHREFANKTGNFEMISYTITPDIDTPPVLHKYGQDLGINFQSWHLLTGSREVIYKLARDSYGADTDTRTTQGEEDFVHSEQAFLVDEQGYLRGIYNVKRNNDIEAIIADIRLLQQEQSI
ncbi:MAG: SCO family protein [Leptospiraceae bacterium]|nr:SCO family protein [Leptospiraceae bacterium]